MSAKRRKESLNHYLISEQKRRSALCSDLQDYQEHVLQPYFEIREEEQKRHKSVDSLCRNELLSTLLRWRSIRKFYTGERGAWSSRYANYTNITMDNVILLELQTHIYGVLVGLKISQE